MEKKSKIGVILAYFYLIIPFFIFSLTWLKPCFGIPFAIIVAFGFFLMCKTAPELPVMKWDIGKLIFLLLLILFWVYLSGVGAFTYQNADHDTRNAIFEVMVNNKWPVVMNLMRDGVMQERGLTYYIAFWIPAAAFGKVFGMAAGYAFQYWWAVYGVIVTYYLMCTFWKKNVIWPFVVFILFDGWDLIGYYLTENTSYNMLDWIHLERWTFLQYSSFTTQLFWVFNQAIPAWILILLLLHQKSNKSIIAIWATGLLYCTIPFVGMLPYVIYMIVKNGRQDCLHIEKNQKAAFFKGIITYQNLFVGGVIGIVSFLYLIMNTAVGETSLAMLEELFFTTVHAAGNTNQGIIEIAGIRMDMMAYIVSIVLNVGIYFVAIYKYQKKKPLYYISLIWLFICPWGKVGTSNDFCMRASIPALLVLFLLVIDSLIKCKEASDKSVFYALVIILAIGSFSAVSEMGRTISVTLQHKYEIIVNDPLSVMHGGNFSCNAEESFFFKYLAEERGNN